MEYRFIGIDISDKKFDICSLDSSHKVLLKNEVFENNVEGIQQFLCSLEAQGLEDIWVCMEHTGHYGALLVKMFFEAGLRFSMVNPLEIKLSTGMVRGKDDKVDAYRIASYAVRHVYKLKPFVLTKECLRQLKLKLSQRGFHVKVMVQCKNNLKSLKVLSASLDVKSESATLEGFIATHLKAIKDLECQMKEIISNDPKLALTYNKISNITGVGFVVATTCIAETENFTRFNNARKFNCHAGLAPFKHESGSSVKQRSRTSSLSNKTLKTLLMRGGITAGIHDPQLNAYKKRKLKEGKHKMIVNNALASKLVARIFAVALRDEPFVKLMA